MTLKKTEMTCPKCGHKFKLENGLAHKIEDSIKEELQAEIEKVAIDQANKDVELKLMEKDKKLDEQKKQIEIMKQKIEQGSTQLQGEVQEVAIENELGDLFRFDKIKEVPKGVRGADAIQIVRNERGIECGEILYESKRTKGFSPLWIEKLRTDQLREMADIAVLVTQQLPADIENIGFKNGVWVCGFQAFKGLALVLRDSLIRIHFAQASQKKKGDKMNMLYDYLTGNEFKLQLEGIVEGFSALKTSIDKERLSMEKLWKEREKQLEKVLINTTDFYGSIKGIAGNAVPDVALLEFSG